jgi:hypothetical protein
LFTSAKLAVQLALQSLRGRQYLQQPLAPQPLPEPLEETRNGAQASSQPVTQTVLSWQRILGRVQLRSPEDVESLLTRLRQQLMERLAQEQQITIE